MKKYQIIYADPPWKYERGYRKRNWSNKYPVMTYRDISLLPIKSIAEDNSVLFMWATAPKLEEALVVLNAWGFKYKSNLIWDKERIGLGFWFRGQHELLLVGTRGKFNCPEPADRICSIFKQKRGEHSAKPNKIRDLIASWYPDKSKIELFARERVNLFGSNLVNWDVWGNEVESDIELN